MEFICNMIDISMGVHIPSIKLSILRLHFTIASFDSIQASLSLIRWNNYEFQYFFQFTHAYLCRPVR